MTVICIFPNGSRKTVSYPKYLVEVAMGKLLEKDECIHHINGDEQDNRLENFEIINRNQHPQKHAKIPLAIDFICPVCEVEFTLDGKELQYLIRSRRAKPNQSGPFCSRRCAGIGSNLQSSIDIRYFSLSPDN
jgi:hypothetical protein